MNKLVVISGCSGGGKSSLISELNRQGYTVFHEVGRELVKEQQEKNSNITPWQNPQAFGKLLLAKSIKIYHQAKLIKTSKDGLIFLDRSFLECISYYQSLKINDYDHFVEELRYYSTIFMTPPWKEIFSQDDQRKKSFEEAIEEYERLILAYPKYGYDIVEIPKINIKNRVEFILGSVYNSLG